MTNSRILVAEDDLISGRLLKHILTRAGFEVDVAANGVEAMSYLHVRSYDAVLTDWMMPEMDGIQMIRRIRETIPEPPPIIMVTAIGMAEAREYALDSGADDFVRKPYEGSEILNVLRMAMQRLAQEPPSYITVKPKRRTATPPFVGVAVAASTGGPGSLVELLKAVPEPAFSVAPVLIVLHGPEWMLSSFGPRLQRETGRPVVLGATGVKVEPGLVYLAPGDRHLTINPANMKLRIDRGPKENFIRPAADPLFRSMADAFGEYSMGVVITGLGSDGTKGAAHIAAAGGLVLAQDPGTATAPSMPKHVIQAGIAKETGSLDRLGKLVGWHVAKRSRELSEQRPSGRLSA